MPRDGHYLLASTLSLTVGYLTGRSQLGYRGIAAPKDLSAAQTAFWANVFAEIDRVRAGRTTAKKTWCRASSAAAARAASTSTNSTRR
jgi:hypothetical protein